MTKDISPLTINPPRPGTKQARLVDMLSRKSGVSLDQAATTLGWQKHTTSAVMTGLRKRGYNITRTDNGDKPSLYYIAKAA
ncbi:MAG: DUF3489 domain-containing protein [Alphaproteobacteria bacterium]